MKSFQEDHSRILERSRNHWKVVSVGTICLFPGPFLMAASGPDGSDSACTVQDSPNQNKIDFVTLALDPSRGWDRWASALLAINGGGDNFYLDTTECELRPVHVRNGVRKTKMIEMIR